MLQEVMADLFTRLEEGEITPPPVTPYAFEDGARAHEALESGRTVGKVVLGVGS